MYPVMGKVLNGICAQHAFVLHFLTCHNLMSLYLLSPTEISNIVSQLQHVLEGEKKIE